MSILYRPVTIETAEQAEALPAGTLARHSEGAGMDHAHKLPSMPGLSRSRWISLMGVESSTAMVGWTALVPIEAEEQWGVEYCEGGDADDTHVSRAVSRENAEWRLGRSAPDAPGWAQIVTRTAATPWAGARLQLPAKAEVLADCGDAS